MGFNKSNDIQDRTTLLEEIRQRAEAAELARIEAEEARLSQSLSAAEETFSCSDPVSTIEESEFDAYPELQVMDEVAFSQENIPPTREDESAKYERIAGLLLSARSKYEREEYEHALRDLDRVATLAPNHAEAGALQHEIQKAKNLSERLLHEEQRRREEEKNKEELLPLNIVRVARESVESQIMGDRKIEAEVPVSTESEEARKEKRSFSLRILSFFGISLVALFGVATVFIVLNQVRVAYFPPTVGVLVLPPSVSHSEAYIADGLTEELLLHLSHLRAVRAYSSNTSRAIRSGDDIATARLLGADYVVQWSIAGTGGSTNIDVTLIQTEQRKPVLEYSSGSMHDELPVWCSDVASRMANAMNVDAKEMQAAFMTSSVNAEAYESYLLGRAMLRESGNVPLDSIISAFSRARSLDPTFPYAETSLGWTHILVHASQQETISPYLDSAQQSLHRAVNLGGGSSEVYRLWGVIDFFKSDFQQAVNRLEQAAQIAASDIETQRWLALAYLRTGRNEEAVKAGQTLVERDPRTHSSRLMLATIHLMNNDAVNALRELEFHSDRKSNSYSDEYLVALVATNQHERAIDILKSRTLEAPGSFIAHYDLGRMYQLAGKSRTEWEKVFLQALQLIDDTLKVRPNSAAAHSYSGLVFTRLGRFGDGLASNANALALSPSDVHILYDSARLHALQRNQSPDAARYLVKAMNKRFFTASVLDLDLARFRNNSGFRDLLMQQDTSY
ncbi:MAG: tetratricopeptide repeat protein [Bacteroidetes bacterium]|nr:tetratricopeptide repeat protein [Bacteroidota bacterium]MCW5895616.1 tetratricopeptide repeat protein [Bacteroidota bacterium]